MQARIAVVDALRAVASGSRDASELENARSRFAARAIGAEGDAVWAFNQLVDALTHTVRWLHSTWNAEPDADRHRRAADLRVATVDGARSDAWPNGLHVAADALRGVDSADRIQLAAHELAEVSIPPRVTGSFGPTESRRRGAGDPDPNTDPASAAILIRFNGEPVLRPAVVKPFALHQFEVEARVAEWPEATDELELSFLSVHPREFLQASSVRFTPDALRQPLEIRVEGERPPNHPPLSLTARAQFRSGGESRPARLAGNTTLELVTFDPGTATPLNMPTAALRLQSMMSELSNALPNLTTDDRRDVRLLLEGVLRYAHVLLDDRLAVATDVDEAWFQSELRTFLQADPSIGARLSERTGRAGGITDLGLGHIVLELKAETSSPITLSKASDQYTGQPTQYASAGDAQVSLVAVLDASEKRAPAGVMGNELAWVYPSTTSGPDADFPSIVGVIVVRSGFPRPSDFSR